MKNTTQDMNNQSLNHNTPLRFLLRFVTMLAVMIAWAMPAKAQTNDIFVYQSDGHYMAHYGSEVQVSLPAQVAAPTSFNPNTCLWEAVPVPASSSYNLRVYGTGSRPDPCYLNVTSSTTFYYASVMTTERNIGNVNEELRTWPKSLVDGSTYPPHFYRYHSTYGWIAAENDAATPYSATANTSAYQVTVTENVGSYQGPAATITGVDELTDFGTFAYSASSSITTVSYNNYYFGGANHYWYENSDHGSDAPVDWSGTLTSTWSIAENSGCATIDASGNLTVHKLPATDQILTLQLTVTDETHTCVFTKDVVLRHRSSYVIKDDQNKYMFLSGSTLGESNSFDAAFTVWDTEANGEGLSYMIYSASGTKYYLALSKWSSSTPVEAGAVAEPSEYNRRWLGTAPDYLKSAGNYYIYRNSNAWKLTNNAGTNHRVIAYPITTIERSDFTTVSGVINENYGEINLLGDYSFTATPSINNNEYDIYTFDDEAHYWYGGSDHASSPETWGNITVGDLTKTWSLASGGDAYASVNSATGELTINDLPASGTVTITLICTITDEGGTHSFQVTKGVVLGVQETLVHTLDDITSSTGHYRLAADFSTTGTAREGGDGVEIGTSTNPFMGTINGNLTTITGTWNKPLFDYVKDATIKNVIIGTVSINITDADSNAGAIAVNAKDETRIYNCGILGGSVSGTKYVGGLVGLLDHKGETGKGSRVVNCFSYADVGGGTDVGGIVGYNNFESLSSDIRTMVMNCVFYGNITSGTKKSPIYGGKTITNANNKDNANQNGLNNYNYYRYNSPYSANKQITDYNCALAAEEKYLIHFELYRQLLNSNKKLAAWYVTGSASNADQMAKWVLESADRTIVNPKPYPVLKAQGKNPSIINYDDDPAHLQYIDPNNEHRNEGRILGSLVVNIADNTSGKGSRNGSYVTTLSKTIVITDKDVDHYNYNYYKVRLPYFNEVGTGNYTKNTSITPAETTNHVVTGWIVTSMTGATPTQAVAGEDITTTAGVTTLPYNFADRTCTMFDNGDYRVFSQGAYFDVPIGVTAITIKPYWANAVFLSDNYLDKTYDKDFNNETNVTVVQYSNGSSQTINGVSLTVYTSFSNALGQISTWGSVYDNAVVLVGNFHQSGVPSNASNKPYTIMSADFDHDNEPDFSLIYYHADRQLVSPIRFDFINIPGTSMAQKPKGSSKMCGIGIFKPYGWFEVTNTTLISFGQFEYDHKDKSSAPLILLGGEVLQIVSNNSGTGIGFTNHTQYILAGGNAWFNEFNVGTHADKTSPTPHRPISVTGGRYEKFYLSGCYRPEVNAVTDDAECYISGGSFGEVAGAGQEQIKGNVTWIIDYADMDNFYGGGINAANAITGNIDVTIRNSYVDVYCGGPKFGDMGTGKTVNTIANGCVFRRFFGAGYGGASFNKVRTQNQENTQPWNTWQGNYTSNRGKYIAANKGVATGFEYEYFIGSKGTIWGRFYVNYTSFSKATVHDLRSELTNCHITGDFYGGGSLGVVDGTATSILDGCTVDGSVFGGGYSATIPTVDVVSAGFATIPTYDANAGVFTPAVISPSAPYIWETGTLTNNTTAIRTENGVNYITTDKDLTNLGEVNTVNLTVKGNSVITGDLHTYNDNGVITATDPNAGGVFGGGDSSAVSGNTTVILQGDTNVLGNVFGGGNEGVVSGNTSVTIQE